MMGLNRIIIAVALVRRDTRAPSLSPRPRHMETRREGGCPPVSQEEGSDRKPNWPDVERGRPAPSAVTDKCCLSPTPPRRWHSMTGT